MLVQAFGILCGLTLAVFICTGARGALGIGTLAMSFVAASVLVLPDRFPDPTWVASGIAAISGLLLWKPGIRLVGAIGAGFAGGVWLRLLQAEGLPLAIAAVLVVAVAAVTALLSERRSNFAPARLRDEALLLLGVYAIVLAAAPSIYLGYESAIALKASALGAPETAPAPWALELGLVFLVSGGAWALWKHR